MVRYEMVPERDGLSVRLFDAPANGWRTLLTEREGMIVKCQREDDATIGVQIYEASDKAALCKAELTVYLESAQSGRPLGAGGVPALARFGEPGHFVYATFTLPKLFIRQSPLYLIGCQEAGPIYSAGWDALAPEAAFNPHGSATM